MESRDIGAVLAIQVASPEIAQWAAQSYALADRPGTFGWVVEIQTAIAGFLIARRVLDEAEILNIAVHPDFRRRGVGSELLSLALKDASNRGVIKAYLEVRASNGPAIEFYKRHGFNESGRRVHYYASPPGDALVLVLQLKNIA